MAAVTPWDRHVIPSIDVLVEIMNPSLVLDKMLANKLVTRSEYLSCKQKSPPDQVRYLFIELLPTKPPVAYEQFRQLLKGTEGQEFLLEEYFPPGTCTLQGPQSLGIPDSCLRAKVWDFEAKVASISLSIGRIRS
jgi:hypothetical protein